MPRTDTEQKDISTLVKKIGKPIIMGDGIQKCLAHTLDITACKIRRLMIVWSYEREGR